MKALKKNKGVKKWGWKGLLSSGDTGGGVAFSG